MNKPAIYEIAKRYSGENITDGVGFLLLCDDHTRLDHTFVMEEIDLDTFQNSKPAYLNITSKFVDFVFDISKKTSSAVCFTAG